MSNLVAIVTGSAHGMGRAIALRLAEDGFNVGINDIASKQDFLSSLAEEIAAKGRKACILPADVSKEEEVAGIVDTVVKELGSLDVVRNRPSALILVPADYCIDSIKCRSLLEQADPRKCVFAFKSE